MPRPNPERTVKAAAKSPPRDAASAWTALGLGIAAAIPLAWCRLLSDEYILPEVVLLSVGLLIAAAAASFSRRSPPPSFSTPLDRPLAAVLLAWGLAAFFSIDPRYSLLGTYGGYTYGYWQVASCAALFLLTAGASDEARRRALKTAMAVATVVSGYAVAQSAGLDPWISAGDLPGHRAVATLGSPAFLGAYLVVWFPTALDWALSGTENRAFGRCALALITAGLLASVSRGAWLSAALGTLVYFRLQGRLRLPRWPRERWIGAAAVLALTGAWAAHALAREEADDEEARTCATRAP